MAQVEKVVETIQMLPPAERREVIEQIVKDLVARDGRDAALHLLMDSIFDSAQPHLQAQVDTLAAFGRMPRETAAALLAPVGPATMDHADCLTDEEVEQILAGAASIRRPA